MAKEWIPYDEQLKHPNWLQVRQWVIERDHRVCTRCFRGQNLQVHHLEYLPGLMAWEYPFKYLTTLCSRCHAIEHGIICEIDFVYRPAGVSRPVLSIAEVMGQVVEAFSKMKEKRDGK